MLSKLSQIFCAIGGHKYLRVETLRGECKAWFRCSKCGARTIKAEHDWSEVEKVAGTSCDYNSRCINCGELRSEQIHHWIYQNMSAHHCKLCGVGQAHSESSSPAGRCGVCGGSYSKADSG